MFRSYNKSTFNTVHIDVNPSIPHANAKHKNKKGRGWGAEGFQLSDFIGGCFESNGVAFNLSVAVKELRLSASISWRRLKAC